MKPPRSTRIFRRTLRGLPTPRFKVGYEPSQRITAADGSTLIADRYFPDCADSSAAADPFPTLLLRSPSGRGFPWSTLYGLAFAEQGFHVVIASCRGTSEAAEGFHPWRDEVADSQATVAWLREQPWFDGRLGTIGPSYMSYTQWALAADPPPELRAMVMQLPLHSPYQFYYRCGVFALEDSLIAGTALAYQRRGTRRYLAALLRLQRAMKRIIGANQPMEAYAKAMGNRAPFLDAAAAHPDAGDSHWQATDLGFAADGLTVPTLIVTGWQDLALDQGLQQYERLASARRSLLVGPWTHASALQQGFSTVFTESLAWLHGHLTGSGRPKDRVQIHVGGDSQWRDFPSWPPPAMPMSWYPGTDGTLSRTEPPSSSSPTTFHYDTADPTPSLGGPGLARTAGVRDNRKLEQRSDVLVFTSEPLTEAVEVAGSVAAEVLVGIRDGGMSSFGPGSAAGHTPGSLTALIFIRLCDVDERGRSWNVCDGIARISTENHSDSEPPAIKAISVAMSSTAHRFLPGYRIRVQISGGAHPRFERSQDSVRISIHPGSAIVVPTI